MGEYRLSPDVIPDLEAITEFIMRDNPPRALSFADELIAKFDVIAERPESFPLLDGLRWPVRSALHGSYRVLFEIIGSVPHILRVVHGARDLDALF